jgi:hypothetical protein
MVSRGSGAYRGNNGALDWAYAVSGNAPRSGNDGDPRGGGDMGTNDHSSPDQDYESELEDQFEPNAGSPQADVLLDVPLLKVDEIDLDVEDLRAKVSLQADVLDLLSLSVGADVALGKVQLKITGVEAQALLKVRLDRVAEIINRVLTTIDRNPQIVERVAAGAAEQLGHGAGRSLNAVGRGAGRALGEVGASAGQSLGELGRGAGQAVADVGNEGGRAISQAGDSADVAGQVLGHAGDAVRDRGPGDDSLEEELTGSRRDRVSGDGQSRAWRDSDRKPDRDLRRRRNDEADRVGDDQARRRPRFARESDRDSGRRPP